MNTTCTPRRPSRSRRAFTLLEILIVIALIGLLAGLTIAKFGGAIDQGSEDIAKTFVSSAIKLPLTSYRIHMGSYPTTAQGLQALVSSPDGTSGRWRGPYLEDKKLPEDPWKRPYQYRYPGTKNPDGYDVFSFGKDGVESDDDIGNW